MSWKSVDVIWNLLNGVKKKRQVGRTFKSCDSLDDLSHIRKPCASGVEVFLCGLGLGVWAVFFVFGEGVS